jgi:hypothetical protein
LCERPELFPRFILTGPRRVRKDLAAEAPLLKSQVKRRATKELYYFRDEQNLEVEFVVPGRRGSLRLVEAKLTRTVIPSMAAPMLRLAEAAKKRRGRGGQVETSLVHESPSSGAVTRALAPGVGALPWEGVEFLEEL